MQKSIYTPVSGALAQERVLEMIANNLANVNTTGFKGDRVSFERLVSEPMKHYASPLPPANYKVDLNKIGPLVGNEVAYVGISDVSRDTAQGPSVQTHNASDLMIEGDGYFVVNTHDGERLTRSGSLNINSQGILVSKQGDPIMGRNGAIKLASGKFEVNQIGEVIQGNQLIDQVRVVVPANEAELQRVGNNLYTHNGSAESLQEEQFPQVKQGYLEGSNVNAIRNMTAMILAHRSYEAYQKAVSNYDQIMEKSSNSIGDIR
jgi:flagellar basal-body rod protein FlgF